MVWPAGQNKRTPQVCTMIYNIISHCLKFPLLSHRGKFEMRWEVLPKKNLSLSLYIYTVYIYILRSPKKTTVEPVEIAFICMRFFLKKDPRKISFLLDIIIYRFVKLLVVLWGIGICLEQLLPKPANQGNICFCAGYLIPSPGKSKWFFEP